MGEKSVAVVTGANKGLGFALVKGLGEKYNGKIYLTSRDTVRGIYAVRELEKMGFNPVFHPLDITDTISISKFCSHIKEQNEKVEILINNAGILFLKDAEEPKGYQAEQTILVNFIALVNFTEAILPLVSENGKILNISSSSGHLSRIPSEDLRKRFSSEELTLKELKKLMSDYVEAVQNNKEIEMGWGESSYVVSKVGVNAYTFMLHRRLSEKGIIVNCVHPGYVKSDMTRGGGSITAEEGAKIPLNLALKPEGRGLYVWHEGTVVPWDGPDPRKFIDSI